MSAEASQNPSAFRLPYVGQITGNVGAEPRNVVFGSVESAATESQRTRWILLIDMQNKSGRASFWKGVVARSSAPYLEAKIVTPDTAGGAKVQSPALPSGIPAGDACWLQVTMGADAPHQQISGEIMLEFPDKERVTLPVYGESL